jgi:Family of unknown function (DUF6308)
MTDYLQHSPAPYLEGQQAIRSVQRYFNPNGAFSGRRFEFLGGGGHRADVANAFTAFDIVAVSLLSVDIPGNASIEILETESEALSKLLVKIPVGVTLWEAREADVDDNSSAAAKLWFRLRDIKGVGWVTANKLVARKRPDLLPVYDNVVKKKLQPRSEEFWIPLRNSLLRDDRAILNRLSEIRELAQLEVEPSLLRILDVAVWMG